MSTQITTPASRPERLDIPARDRPEDDHPEHEGASLAPPRVVIEAVAPEIDHGRFPIKRTVGEEVVVSADIFTEGHDLIAAVVKYRPAGESRWEEARLEPLVNDRWTGRFVVTRVGWYEYTLEAWVDHFATWSRELSKKHEAGQDVASELLEGAQLVREASGRADGLDAPWLRARADRLAGDEEQAARVAAALDPELARRMARHADRRRARTYEPTLRIQVERERARFGAWYETFPRSASAESGRHGTFRDLEARLPYIASMGFDVLYLPPVHPIGRSFRKGPNNTLTAAPADPGSPWAIGAAEGGHTAVHPDLGTLKEFDHLVTTARHFGLEIALDIAFQCAPDHPWVVEHPEWFRHRPDGTIKYAENPPKKYQDIYPLNFETEHWRSLWEALRDVFLFWIDHGVSIFRVDNPHTKAFPFWEWCLREVWERHPQAIFLSEAFTRPKVMKYLAKLGFTQSYTYFTWRNDKAGLTEYFTELTQTECAEYMRPNLFANTPDILHEYLQTGGRAAFQARLVLAATLGATYGIYGPPFELCDGTPVRAGSEEYLDSEKYQVRHWNLDEAHSLRPLIARLNTIRRLNPALHANRNLRFFHIDNPQIIAYGKATADLANVIIVVVNLDPYNVHSGWLTLPVEDLKLDETPDQPYQVHDLLNDARYNWRGPTNFVMLDPHQCPAHVFRVRRKVRSEHDFEYFE
jgi:starch synthase (maltosyl-transferring)